MFVVAYLFKKAFQTPRLKRQAGKSGIYESLSRKVAPHGAMVNGDNMNYFGFMTKKQFGRCEK